MRNVEYLSDFYFTTKNQLVHYIIVLSLLLFHLACNAPSSASAPNESDNTAMAVQESLDTSLLNTRFVMGHFEPEKHGSFTPIPIAYADREGMWMLKDAFDSFVKMHDAARREGVKLIIRSAARNFDYQKGIWERKWTGETGLSDGTKASDLTEPVDRALKILLYSSMPGTSRHHWGTDIDLNSFSNEYFESEEGKKIFDWLNQHASSFGFCLPYTDKGQGRTGYEMERWHWSYKPVSLPLSQFYKQNISLDQIKGFMGSETSAPIDVINKYVLGIDPLCQS